MMGDTERMTATEVMEFQKRQKVVCAAIQLKDGLVVTGARHFCPTMVAQLERIKNLDDPIGFAATSEQGFIDQWGNFLTRQQAYVIAERQDQFKGEGAPHTKGCLYSEDLY